MFHRIKTAADRRFVITPNPGPNYARIAPPDQQFASTAANFTLSAWTKYANEKGEIAPETWGLQSV